MQHCDIPLMLYHATSLFLLLMFSFIPGTPLSFKEEKNLKGYKDEFVKDLFCKDKGEPVLLMLKIFLSVQVNNSFVSFCSNSWEQEEPSGTC